MKKHNKKDGDKDKKRYVFLIILILLFIIFMFSIVFFSFSYKDNSDLNIDIGTDNNRPVIEITEKITTNKKTSKDINNYTTKKTTSKTKETITITKNNNSETTTNRNQNTTETHSITYEPTKNVKTTTSSHKTTTKTHSTTHEPTTTESIIDEGIFSVRDTSSKWAETTSELKIFDKTEELLAAKGKIAPGLNDNYIFTIRNNNDFSINVKAEFIETNNELINMKYRLKMDNHYIIGDRNTWVTSNDLIINKYEMKSKTKKTYTLEWKWFEGANDTQIGLDGVITYKLEIKVIAEGISE